MTKKNNVIIADLDYVMGHLRYGHFKLEVDDEELDKILAMNKQDQEDYITELGVIVIDDISIEYYGPVNNIQINGEEI